MEHEAAAGLDRTALEHLHRAGATRQLDEIGVLDHFELHQQIGKIDVRGRLIDDDAHRPFRRMGADVDQRSRETLVAHGVTDV